MRLNLGGVTGALNAIGGIKKAQQDQQDSDEAKALREKLANLEVTKVNDARDEANIRAGQEDRRSKQEDTRLAQSQADTDLRNKEFEFQTGEAQRKTAEQHLSEQATRAQLKKLFNINPDPGMDLQTLNMMLNNKMDEQARVKEIAAQHTYNAAQNMEIAARQVSIANTAMMSSRRYYNDTVTRIMSDPGLMRQYAAGMKSGNPNAMQDLVKQVAGRDLWAEYNAAGVMVQRASQQAFAYTGSAFPALSPAAAKATTDAMPYSLKSPEDQSRIAAEYAAKIKAGQPVDLRQAAVDGIPVDSIAKTQGFAIDPMTGASAKVSNAPAASVPGAGGQTVSPFGIGLGSGGGMAAPPAVGRGIESFFGGGGSNASAPPSAPATMAPSPMAPQPNSPTGATLPNGQPVTDPMSGQIIPPAPATDPNMGGFALSASMATEQNLRTAHSLPDAERSARQLLDQGHDYDDVISRAPAKYQSMLAAKLPKRIPQSATGAQPAPAPFTPGPTPPSLPMGISHAGKPPIGPNSLSPNRPLFSPPQN